MTLAKFTLIAHDLNVLKNLDEFPLDLNPQRIHNDCNLVFIYLDSEENLKKEFILHAELAGLNGKLIGICLPGKNVFNWLQNYPSIIGCLDIDQFKLLLRSNQNINSHDGIFLKVKNKFEKIHFKNICWIMAKDMYSIIRTADARFLVSHSLKEMEEKLIPYSNFKRIHRSYLVNIDFIEAIEEGELIIDSEPIPIGPAYKEELMARLLFM